MRDAYDILIYSSECSDFENEGLCGPLSPTECVCTMEAGGDYSLTMEHPYDAAGRWRLIAAGCILKAWVQTRTPPALDASGDVLSTVEVYTAASTASNAERTLWNARTDGSAVKVVPAGTRIVVTESYTEGRWRVSTAYGAGWMESTGIEYQVTETLDTPGSLDGILGAAEVRPQLFEILSVERTEASLTVEARHISYRLMKNVTTYNCTGSATLRAALAGVLDNTLDAHVFSARTNLLDERTGLHWARWNPIKCFMDPEEGILGRWTCEMLRDNFDFYFLSNVGADRGVVVEAGKNLAGITVTEDVSGVATYVMPVGSYEDGSALLLPEVWLVSDLADQYPQKLIYVFDAEDAQVGESVTEAVALTRMRAQAQALLDAGCDLPALGLQVELAQLETGAEDLEPLCLYDVVTVIHPDLGVTAQEKVLRIEWDCIMGRIKSLELGTLSATMTGTALATWQIPSGISGSKLAAGSVTSTQLADTTVIIPDGSLEAAKLSTTARSVLAQEGAAEAAEELTALETGVNTDALYAALAHALELAAASGAGELSDDPLMTAVAKCLRDITPADPEA